ncbi:hypothetical protein [Streptomyces virginiae]|uniref:hypothetical protein n=1 Tax=Streptomyces virginiae TaxID=1961 RepID=UPI0022511DA8|nr:hypothetical protein [Streptomyces virginiae]MCX5270070.1 hypothetical protein [Streptomyces virginiae]
MSTGRHHCFIRKLDDGLRQVLQTGETGIAWLVVHAPPLVSHRTTVFGTDSGGRRRN